MEDRKSAAAVAALTMVLLIGAATVAALAGFSLPSHPSPPPATVKPLSVIIVNKKHVIASATTVPEADTEPEPETTDTADTIAG